MKLRVLIFCAICCAWLAGPKLWGQTAAVALPDAADARTASLVGHVVTEPGAEPIKKAIIELVQEGGDSTHNYTATSAPDGSFDISGIEPGRYRILVEKTGFVFVDAKHRSKEASAITLLRGQALPDQTLRMWPTAVLTGRVLDEDGEPMPDSQVEVLQHSFTASREPRTAGSGTTNDLGQFRISGIMPGRYVVRVVPHPDVEAYFTAQKSQTRKGDLAYVPLFFPNVTDLSQAEVLDLRPGEETPVDFSLARVPTATIRGTVPNVAGGATAVVMLEGDESNINFNQTEVGKDGKFEIRHVAPGSFNIYAIEYADDKALMAKQALEIHGSDIEGLRLVPMPGATIRGQLHLSGAGPGDFSRLSMSIHSVETGRANLQLQQIVRSYEAGSVKSDGSFEWKDVPPGSYFVEVAGYGATMNDVFVESVNLGGKNVRDSGFNVAGGTVTMDVTLGAKAPRLEGAVLDQDGHGVANAVVIAMPEERFRKRSERYGKATTDQHGQFSMHGLIPGEYSVVAWEALEGDPYVDPAFRKPYEAQAVRVRVEGAAPAPISVKAQPAPDDATQ